MDTGGFSSTSSPLVGFALKLVHTPPFPPPYTRPLAGGCVLKAGSSVTLLCRPGGGGAWCSGCGFPRISRWRSSRPSSSSSSSESESNVSARVRSWLCVRGSSESRRRDVGEEAREWNDGGGEAGGHCCRGATGESASSLAATWSAVSTQSCARAADTSRGNAPFRSLGLACWRIAAVVKCRCRCRAVPCRQVSVSWAGGAEDQSMGSGRGCRATIVGREVSQQQEAGAVVWKARERLSRRLQAPWSIPNRGAAAHDGTG